MDLTEYAADIWVSHCNLGCPPRWGLGQDFRNLCRNHFHDHYRHLSQKEHHHHHRHRLCHRCPHHRHQTVDRAVVSSFVGVVMIAVPVVNTAPMPCHATLFHVMPCHTIKKSRCCPKGQALVLLVSAIRGLIMTQPVDACVDKKRLHRCPTNGA